MRINAALFLASGLAWGITLPATAQSPLSAIDWLSQSVTLPATAAPSIPPVVGQPGDVVTNALPEAVTVMPLDTPDPNGIGLRNAAQIGVPDALWSGVPQRVLVRAWRHDQTAALPAMRQLYRGLAIVAAAPPLRTGSDGAFFLARVDALLGLGDLETARALLERAGVDTTETFRRWFDIALLTGAENKACARMRALPDITPTYPARIFCLARGGDWAAAALTLDTAEALDVISPEDDALLLRFLDDHAESGGERAARPSMPSPLDFALYEAVGAPLDTSTLPLAFAHADLRDNTGWKARIEAAERLARVGAIPPGRLWAIYSERRPAASGGVWDRAQAIQRLDTALDSTDVDLVGKRLIAAWDALQQVGLAYAFAQTRGRALSRLPLTGEAAHIANLTGLLSGNRAHMSEGDAPGMSFLRSLAEGRPDPALAKTDPERAVSEAFVMAAPDHAADRLADGRAGEVLLDTMTLMREGAAGNLDELRDGLAILRAAGLDDVAVDAALQFLILRPRG